LIPIYIFKKYSQSKNDLVFRIIKNTPDIPLESFSNSLKIALFFIIVGRATSEKNIELSSNK